MRYLEATINAVVRLCGGKKKRKKKIYTKPKKIGHKHKKRPKAILEYFNVDNTGKIQKLKIECEKCPAGKLASPCLVAPSLGLIAMAANIYLLSCNLNDR